MAAAPADTSEDSATKGTAVKGTPANYRYISAAIVSATAIVSLLVSTEASSPWPAQTPPRIFERTKCADQDEFYLKMLARLQLLEAELAAQDGDATSALEEQLDAVNQRIAFANSSDWTCAVGCRHTTATHCEACPQSYTACSPFGGCHPASLQENQTVSSDSTNVECTCLEGFTGRFCHAKTMSVASWICLAFVALCFFIDQVYNTKNKMKKQLYPPSSGEAEHTGVNNAWNECCGTECVSSTDDKWTQAPKLLRIVFQVAAKLVTLAQLQQPAFDAGGNWSVDYGLPEWPEWLSWVDFDFVPEDAGWELQFWIVNGVMIVAGMVVCTNYEPPVWTAADFKRLPGIVQESIDANTMEKPNFKRAIMGGPDAGSRAFWQEQSSRLAAGFGPKACHMKWKAIVANPKLEPKPNPKIQKQSEGKKTLVQLCVAIVELATIPFFRIHWSFYVEFTSFEGTNEMRWAVANAEVQGDASNDLLFEKMTEHELVDMRVDSNFFDTDPAVSRRWPWGGWNRFHTYFLLSGVLFAVGLVVILVGVNHADRKKEIRSKPLFALFLIQSKVHAPPTRVRLVLLRSNQSCVYNVVPRRYCWLL